MSGTRSFSPLWIILAVVVGVAAGVAYVADRTAPLALGTDGVFADWIRGSAADIELALQAILIGIVVIYGIGFAWRALVYILALSAVGRRLESLGLRGEEDVVDADTVLRCIGPHWTVLPSSAVLRNHLNSLAAMTPPRIGPSDLKVVVDRSLLAGVFRSLPLALVGVAVLTVPFSIPSEAVGPGASPLSVAGGPFVLAALAVAVAVVMHLVTAVVLAIAYRRTQQAESALEQAIRAITRDLSDARPEAEPPDRRNADRERLAGLLASLAERTEERLDVLLETTVGQLEEQGRATQGLVTRLDGAMSDVQRALSAMRKVAQAMERLVSQAQTAAASTASASRQAPGDARLVQLINRDFDASALRREVMELHEEVEALIPAETKDEMEGRSSQ